MVSTIEVNGTAYTVGVDGDTLRSWLLRDLLGLAGTKFGCGAGPCGACTVHVAGAATRSCVTAVDSIGNSEVTTIEAVGKTPRAGVLQRTWPNIHVDYVRVEPPGIPTAFWRGVGLTHSVFVVESFIDELAAAAGQDPVAYRRALLGHNPRALGVLDLAAEKADWGGSLPARRGRGVPVQFAFGSYLAQVAEVEVAADGAVRVHRIVCAVVFGLVVNPDTIAAQVEGGSIFGLTAVLHGAITLKDVRVEQGNFDTYRPMRIDEVPAVETRLVRSGEAPGGIGEAPTCAVGPAVANAIFPATGRRVRTPPVDARLLKV